MSDTPYSSEYFKARVVARKQAGDECENCGISDRESEDRFGKVLVTHHITPVRMFDDEREAHTPDNLTLLCPRCHMNEEFGAFTTSHKPETRLEKEVIRFLEEVNDPIEMDVLIRSFDAGEPIVRGAVARMVSGGHLRLTAKGEIVFG